MRVYKETVLCAYNHLYGTAFIPSGKIYQQSFSREDTDFQTEFALFEADKLFPCSPFVFWEEGNNVVAGYHSLELKSDDSWKYRDTKETLEYIHDNKGRFGELHVDDNGFILDGDRLIATSIETFKKYFNAPYWGDLIGTDTDGNYYAGYVESCGVFDKKGKNLFQCDRINSDQVFPVRVDPFGVMYTIRFNEETKDVELWKLDPGVISEERRYEIAATARSEFYESLCAIAGKPVVQTADLWGIPEATITESGVRVRNLPNTDAEIITILDKGTKVRVIGRNAEKSTIGKATEYWYKIALKDTSIGWVFGAFVSLKNPEALRVSEY